MSSSADRRLGPLLVGAAFVLVLAVAVVSWLVYSSRRSSPDMVAVLQANSQGVGLMEQFAYEKAAQAFEKVVRLAPDWTPGQINLGIALLNVGSDQSLARATELFQRLLRRDPDNPYAHYCLGIIALYQDKLETAYPHFQAVTRIDPTDAYSWYHCALTNPDGRDSPAARDCFKKALALNPYLNAARYGLAMHPLNRDPERTRALLAEHKALMDAEWEQQYAIKYSEMGKYAEVIGLDPNAAEPKVGPLPLFEKNLEFQVTLAPGVRWATAADLGAGPLGELRRLVRDRFGATMVLLDYNRDGRPDLFLLSAVVDKGHVRDLLLRNDGQGRFADVTAEAGLAQPQPSLGCCVADVDNDGFPDLLITGAGEQRLFRNTGKGTFVDASASAGLEKLSTVCLGCAAVDLDQDSDLDLILAQYADNVDNALKRLRGEEVKDQAGLVVLINTSEAPPVKPNDNTPPLTLRFQRDDGPKALLVTGPVTGLAVSDLDGDGDLDLLVLPENRTPDVVLNDRLLRFHRPKGQVAEPHSWNGALVFYLNHGGLPALLILPSGQKPILLVDQARAGEEDIGQWFTLAPVQSPPLRQAQAVDMDLDSWTDVIGLSENGKPVLLQNDGAGRLVHRPDALGSAADWPKDLVAVLAADLEGNCRPDVLLWSEAAGLQLRRNLGNLNKGLHLEVTGRRDKGNSLRTNADGIGVHVVAQAGTLWTGIENTTLAAGLGQSRMNLLLGIGRHDRAEVVRLRWPDLIPQAELDVPACELVRLQETSRKIGSCPLLLTWDGRRFAYITDFLGAGAMGEMGPDGSTRPPRPEESVKIEAGQLLPREGFFVLKIAEPMDEILYLDRLQLVVLDQPPGVSVYPDERFATRDPQPTQDLLVLGEKIFPKAARDHRGRDVTAVLRHRDKWMVDGFDRRSWLGYAEEHWVELDFGDRLANLDPKQRLVLCLAGWTDYPYPESIYAATQAGVSMLPPVLERLDTDGKWQPVDEIGFPAGLPRMMTKELTGLLPPGASPLRLRTNLRIFWDQIYLAPLLHKVAETSAGAVRATALEVADANLLPRGFMQEIKGPGQLMEYDDSRTELVAVTAWTGRFTRFGDVSPLLRKTDDCFVISGPGEEITVRFDARHLPVLPPDWTRAFVLRFWGFSKDSASFTRTAGSVEPMPFRAMTGYPYGPSEAYPTDALHTDYLRRYQTRHINYGTARRNRSNGSR